MISRHPFNLRNVLRGPQPAASFAVLYATASVTSDTTAVIEWTLNQVATGQVEYGLTVAYGSTTALASSLYDRHSQTIGTGVNPTPLTPGETYYFRVMSQNAAGEWAYATGEFTMSGSGVSTVGPRAAPAIPTGPSVKIIGTHTVAVDNTGTTNVTATLQGILNNLNAGDTLVFNQASDAEGYVHGTDDPLDRYLISSPLLLNVPDSVTLWGYGTQIQNLTRASENHVFQVNRHDMDGLSIKGFELYGANSSVSRTPNIYTLRESEKSHGIALWRRTTNTLIEDCWIRHMQGDAINQPGWGSTNWVGIHDITVRYCLLEDSKRQGLVPNVGLDWWVHHNRFSNIGAFSIDAEDTDPAAGVPLPSLSIIIEDNEFDTCGWWEGTTNYGAFHINFTWGWNNDGPPNYDQLGPITIRRNTVTRFLPAVLQGAATPFFYGNYGASSANTGNWSDYDRIEDVLIEDNVFDLPAEQQGSASRAVYARANDGITVRDNTFQGCTISVPTTGYGANTDVTISGNT